MTLKTTPVRLSFTEQMQGYLTFGEDDYERGAQVGRQAGRKGGMKLTLRLNITFSDLDRAISSPDHGAQAGGWVRCDALGGKLPVEWGTFNLFVGDDPNQKTMVYRIFCRDGVGYPLTLIGVKTVRRPRGPGLYVWRDTTTLYLRVVQGHVHAGSEIKTEVVASGILRLGLPSFIKQLTTFRTDAPTFGARFAAIGRFDAFFLGQLWRLYNPAGRLEPRP